MVWTCWGEIVDIWQTKKIEIDIKGWGEME